MNKNTQEQVTKTSYLRKRFLRLRFLRSIPKFIIALLLPSAIIAGLAVIEGDYLSTNKKQTLKENQEQKSQDNQYPVEECNSENKNTGWILWLRCQLKSSETVNLIEGYSIIAAAILFALESKDRKKQSHSQSWQMIDGAKDVETSYARYHALQDLNRDNVSLTGVDIPYADLPNIDLRGADLRNVNLKGAKLEDAKLQGANLERADLEDAELTRAKLNGAYLYLANLKAVDLNSARLQHTVMNTVNLQKAKLHEANLQGADLRGANLRGANLKETIFDNADIEGADLRSVKNINLLQLKNANNWQKAIYDETFHPEETQLIRKKELIVEEPKIISNIININEIIQKINQTIKLIEEDNRNPTSNQMYSNLSDIKNAIENIFEKNDNYDITTKEKVIEQLAEIKEGITKREKGKELKEYDLVAGKWLALKQKSLACIAGNSALEKNHTLCLNGGMLDSHEKVQLFYQDINSLLEILSFYISKSQRPQPIYEGAIELRFPKSLYKDAFIVIVEQAIPEILNTEPNQLSKLELERLNGHLSQFIYWLQSTNIT